ncbi:hypothetical protein MNBD_ALPHA12-1707 [hydrothermal vent metagenome]|uniref:DUF1499 domain-containing protein n=1 Tax=hydrothermal vent metagenome TaxID=652676 RepID=A0A3B0U9X4_9ZZZZ
MRISIRTSKWAIWARRLGGFAVPVLVIAVFLHRAQVLASDSFITVFMVGLIIAALGLVVGIVAYVRLWHSGERGWGKATIGVVLGLACLSPVIYGAIQFARYPVVNDVATDWAAPLPLVLNPDASIPDGAVQKEVIDAFPDIGTRTYQLATKEVFNIVEKLVVERGWDIRVRRSPVFNNMTGRINALTMTLFGWRDEIAIRVSSGVDGVRVDMRSASLFGVSDLGVNGRRIESFLFELDQRLGQASNSNQGLAKTH